MRFLSRRTILSVLGATISALIILHISAIFFHGGAYFFRPLSRFILPPLWVADESFSYHCTVEVSHAFVALGIFSSYRDAFPHAVAFGVRDARLRVLLGEDRATPHALTESDTTLLRAAGLSDREIMHCILLPMGRWNSASGIRSRMLPAEVLRKENILAKLHAGMPFYDAATYFSEDISQIDGGELGIFTRTSIPAWASDVFLLEQGEYTDGFIGQDSEWIFFVAEKGGEGEGEWVRLRGIAISQPSLAEVFLHHAEEVPARIFVW